jgi:hypothetical protein
MIAAGLYFVEHFELLKRLFADMNKNVRFCAAELINVFQRWREWKIKHHRTEWVYYKQKMLKEELRDRYSMHVVRSAVEYLLEAEILERRNNPSNGQDKTFQYRLNLQKLSELMALDCKIETEESMFETENTDFTNENHTQDPTTESTTEIPSKAEVETNQELDGIGQSEKVSLLSKVKSPPAQGRMGKDDDIPQELKAKLENLSIPLDNRVRSAIASHHISQAYSAIAHIENTRETISNPRGVFLFQINKQPVEPMGSRGREYKASDFNGYTLERIKSMYPNSWREAAVYFGLSVLEVDG